MPDPQPIHGVRVLSGSVRPKAEHQDMQRNNRIYRGLTSVSVITDIAHSVVCTAREGYSACVPNNVNKTHVNRKAVRSSW
jgi:hypothetical protein